MRNVLIIVDPQNDFITGSLAVEGAEAKMKNLTEYLKEKGDKYDFIAFTADSHPENHCSFKENGGIWPKHCVAFTDGWFLPEDLADVLDDCKQAACYHKGELADREEYSIFDSEEDGNTLAYQLRNFATNNEVYFDICGIAGDYCVLETLKGLVGLVGNNYISILDEFTASIDGGEKLRQYAEANNINIVTESITHLEEYVR